MVGRLLQALGPLVVSPVDPTELLSISLELLELQTGQRTAGELPCAGKRSLSTCCSPEPWEQFGSTPIHPTRVVFLPVESIPTPGPSQQHQCTRCGSASQQAKSNDTELRFLIRDPEWVPYIANSALPMAGIVNHGSLCSF